MPSRQLQSSFCLAVVGQVNTPDKLGYLLGGSSQGLAFGSRSTSSSEQAPVGDVLGVELVVRFTLTSSSSLRPSTK